MKFRIGFNARCLVEPEVRGLSRYTGGLLRALSKFPHLEIILFSDLPPYPGHLLDVRAIVRVFPAARESLWNDWLLPQKLREEKIDLFHAPADRGLPLRKPCPLIVTIHDSYERLHWPTLYKGTKSRLFYWKHELVNYLRADAIITVSDTTRNKLANIGVAPERKLHKTYLAPSPEFHPLAGPVDEKIIKQYAVGEPYILYVGGYDQRKNVDCLVKAFDQAAMAHYSLVIIAQKIWGFPVLCDKWRKLPCFPRLHLLEVSTEEIPSFYRKADFFVNPSLHESFSFQLLEAMACGTPVLASNREAIPEILGGAGLLFDPEDLDGLSRLLEKLGGDEALKNQLRKRGLERVKSFSWEKTARETVQVYSKVLNRSLV
jgi:glycosyltransferase involved in cell wall biosynthesis